MKKRTAIIEEQARLDYVIELINIKLEKAREMFKKQENFIIGFKEGQRGTHFIRQGMMSLYATEEYDLERILPSPYFGRMDFQENGNPEILPIYIGKKTLTDQDGKIVIYDWRTPICNMYYDYPLGQAQYYNGSEITSGEIKRKRQPIIENSKLIDVLEQDTLTDDKILLRYLSENADSRLKSIVATIQREQNQIIRSPLRENYLIQGVAGSGKTTVALHRIAYLIYNEAKNIRESEFMILGPNNYFLNYISGLLPDLDIKTVSQSTFEEIAMNIINSKLKLDSQNVTLQKILSKEINPNIIKFKSSIEYLNLLQTYIQNYIISNLQQPIMYEGIELCSSSRLISMIDSINFNNKKFINYNQIIKSIINLLTKEIKEKSPEISHEIWLRYRDEFLSLSKDNPRKKEILEITENINKELKKGCQKTLKEYFKFINITPLKLYISFIESLSNSTTEEFDIDINQLQSYTLNNLKKKKISNEDLAPLLLINYLIKGINIYENFEHLVIDEGQDLSIAQYYVLKLLFPKCTYDIYGDLNQSIYTYQGIRSWDELNDLIFNSKAIKLSLSKGYRTTAEISDGANYVLDEIGSKLSESIARYGEQIKIENLEQTEIDIKILEQINIYLDKGYKTIAIICKDDIETDNIYKNLKKIGINIHRINEEDQTYEGGLCIMPAYLSKGLEFDGVIIYDANNEKYDNKSEIDMKLLYVAMTRALHELSINYSKTLSKPLVNLVEQKKVKIRKK